MSATMKMFCMFITLVSYFISVRQIYDTFIVHTLTEDVKVKSPVRVDIRIGDFFRPQANSAFPTSYPAKR